MGFFKVKDYDKFDKWVDETESLEGIFMNTEVSYTSSGVYINDTIYQESNSLDKSNLEEVEDILDSL